MRLLVSEAIYLNAELTCGPRAQSRAELYSLRDLSVLRALERHDDPQEGEGRAVRLARSTSCRRYCRQLGAVREVLTP